MSKPMILFVCGPHCSGKSSVLKYLCEEAYFSAWGPEVGKELFYQYHFDTAVQGQDFEFEVSRKELERDKEYSKAEGIIGIESWHPGNLAYAAVRNPAIVPQLTAYMKRSPLISEAYGIRFHIAPETIKERTRTFAQKKDWAVEFYQKIDQNLGNCIERLGLRDRCVSIDADQEFTVVTAAVKKAVEDFRKNISEI